MQFAINNAEDSDSKNDFDIESYKNRFVSAMDDDLNTSKALAVLFELTNKANKDENGAFTVLYKLATALGFTFDKPELTEDDIKNALSHVSKKLDKTFNSMDELLAYRKTAREEKNWPVADAIRIALDECGILLKDSKEGTIAETK